MGSGSKSVSQETEEPVQQPLLTRQPAISGSNTTINSDCNSMSTTNDQHTLLPVNREEEDTGERTNTLTNRILGKSQNNDYILIWLLFSRFCCSNRLWESNDYEHQQKSARFHEYSKVPIKFNDITKCELCIENYHLLHVEIIARIMRATENAFQGRIIFYLFVCFHI